MRNRRKRNKEMRLSILAVILFCLLLGIFTKVNDAKKLPDSLEAYIDINKQHVEYAVITAEKGDTIWNTCEEVIEKYNMDDIVTTREYVNIVRFSNDIVGEKQMISGHPYTYPYVMDGATKR